MSISGVGYSDLNTDIILSIRSLECGICETKCRSRNLRERHYGLASLLSSYFDRFDWQSVLACRSRCWACHEQDPIDHLERSEQRFERRSCRSKRAGRHSDALRGNWLLVCAVPEQPFVLRRAAEGRRDRSLETAVPAHRQSGADQSTLASSSECSNTATHPVRQSFVPSGSRNALLAGSGTKIRLFRELAAIE